MKYTSRFLSILVSFTLLVAASPGVASAHVLKEDNGISALLHIEPDDNPVAGQPTVLKLDFGDRNDAFNLVHCRCQLQLAVNEDQVIKTVTLAPGPNGGTLDTTATVTFPKIDKYDVILKGQATDGSFPDFHLDYDVAVDTASTVNKGVSGSDVLLLSGAALIAFVPLIFLGLKYGSRAKK